MGVIKTVRDAARSENSITHVPDGVQARDVTSPTNPVVEATPSAANSPSSKRPAHKDEPEAIARAYYVENAGKERRYYDDYQRKTLAMRASETSISSKREDLTTVRSMVEVAASRGWGSIDLKGSENFRREAWIEASARGLESRGYKASDPDRQEAERRAANSVNRSPVATPQTATPSAVADLAKGQAKQPSRSASPSSPSSPPAPPSTPGRAPAKDDQAEPTNRQKLRAAQNELSPDARLVLAALSEKIDRQMAKQTSETKLELKAFAAGELVKRERVEGPVVLTAEQKRIADRQPGREDNQPDRLREPRPPHRSLAR